MEDNNILSDCGTKAYKIRVSVRQLVEFVLRNGDIDNRRTSNVENAMQEGSRLHRMIQKRMGSDYYPEVLLNYRYITDKYEIEIEGRADGIIIQDIKGEESLHTEELLENEKSDDKEESTNKKELERQTGNSEKADEIHKEITIDEIKCVAKSLEYINEPVAVHLAQAKVYAFIYSQQNKLPMIRVRMTYCNMETEEIKYFFQEYSCSELNEWFLSLMDEYKKWADFQYEWQIQRTSSIKKIDFPFEYRKGQKELAINVYKTISQKRKIFIEAPTGVGKTISTLFPTIKSMGENLTERIFYLTAKTITRTVAEETINILRKQALKLKSVTITAKDKICILEKSNCNPSNCERAKGHYDRVNDAMYEIITKYDSIDRSVIEEIALKYKVCPFELSLDVSLFSDVIICDYNYVFDPHASLKRFFSEGMKGDYAFLIDEAHNLVERGREMYSASLCKEDFLLLKHDLKNALEQQTIKKNFKKPSIVARLIKALERCNKELLALKRECDSALILETSDPFTGLVESLYNVMNEFLEEEDDSPVRENVLEFFFEISHYLYIYEKMDENYTIYCQHNEEGKFVIKLFCVNPKNNLKEAMAKGRSSILFSATLLPIQYYKNLLGGVEEDYETYAKSTFDNSKRGLFIANDVTSKYSRRNDLEYHKIASYIFEITNAKQGNYMVFLPSHSFLSNVLEHFRNSFFDENEMDLIVQEEYMNEEMREMFLKQFDVSHKLVKDNTQKKTLIGFCVLGGIFSEGIDLKEDSLIGSIIVGTGIPLVCNEREILKDYFDEDAKTGFNYAYRYPGMNKVLQAAGRVIRTVNDVGIVALLDERFNSVAYKSLFPREWENAIIVNNMNVSECVNEFWLTNSKKMIYSND